MSELTDKLILEQLVKVNEKQGKLILLGVENREISKEILAEKKANHSAWLGATDRRFYVSLVTVVLMVSAFYAEKDNAFINGMVEWWEALKVVL